jgi:hypothetical protein
MQITSPEEFTVVELRDIDLTLIGGQKLNLTLRHDDQRTDYGDAIRVRFDKTGEVVTV